MFPDYNIITYIVARELCPLPQLTPEGYGCLLFRLSDPDPDKFQFYDFVKTFFMVGDVRARFETELVKGLVPILDMTGWSLKHITKASIFSVRKYIKYCQVRTGEHLSFAFAKAVGAKNHPRYQ